VGLHLVPWQSLEWLINSVLLACCKSNTLGMYSFFMVIDLAAPKTAACNQLSHVF